MRVIDGQNAFVLASKPDTHAGRDVVLTAKDVRQLQLVKGSILAATAILCHELDLEYRDIEAILIAGAFGNTVRKASALAIGLIVESFRDNAVAARMRCDQRARRRASALAARAEYVELAHHPDYQKLFLAMLGFPAGAASAHPGFAFPEAGR
jgi:uncharacterized 2Fe-2S/4Fe-4S cluster protein (DUF4445 family)